MVLARRRIMAGLISIVAAGALACGGDSPLEVPTPTLPATTTTNLPTPGPVATATTAAPAPTPTVAAGGPQEYTIQAGDTLGAIAAQFGVTVEAIVEANSIADPNLIVPGETLIIPAP
jgi:LysM repeat protein